MNRGGNASPMSGFTIVETLIVLAVTSALLVSAMLAMSGRQARTEFQVGRESAVRELQSTISQIESGRYQTKNNFTCRTDALDRVIFTSVAPGSGTQGANEDCTFLGLGLVFGQAAGTYDSYVIAGTRTVSGLTAKTITESKPTTDVLTRFTNSMPRGFEYVGSRYVMANGTDTVVTGATTPVVVRLMVDLEGAEMLNGNIAGSPKVSVHATEPWNSASVVSTINGATPEDIRRGIKLCLGSTGTDQSIILSLGNGQGNKVTSTVVTGNKCGWPLP